MHYCKKHNSDTHIYTGIKFYASNLRPIIMFSKDVTLYLFKPYDKYFQGISNI